jgi:hypothetical protein
LTDGQQIISEMLKQGAPYTFIDGVSFLASEEDIQQGRTLAVDSCLNGLRKQAEEMLSKLQQCFVGWRRIKIRDQSELSPIPYPEESLIQLFNYQQRWFQQLQSSSSSGQSQSLDWQQLPFYPDQQTVKVSVTAVARFEDCGQGGNNQTNSTGGSQSTPPPATRPPAGSGGNSTGTVPAGSPGGNATSTGPAPGQ